MQALSVFAKVFGASHKSAHRFENRSCLGRHLIPGSFQSMDGRCTESRNDGCERRVVVQLPAFLYIVSMASIHRVVNNLHRPLGQSV